MKVILNETGGLLGRTKVAEAEWTGPMETWKEMLEKIKVKTKRNQKDGYRYVLTTINPDKKTQISINDIPAPLKDLFDELFQNLKIEP